MDSYNRYDYILGGIACMIILMLTGILVDPSMSIVSGVAAAALIGVGMFVIPPVDIDRKI